MKPWKMVLLQAGIFVTVFSLSTGIGFVSCYHKPENVTQDTNVSTYEPVEETPAEKFLSNLTTSKALSSESFDITILKDETSPEGSIKALTRSLDQNIYVHISDLDISIADIDNLKVQGYINFQMGDIDVNFTVSYFDNTVYLDYLDTHFYLQTDDFGEALRLLPLFGVNINLTSLNFISFDLDTILDGLSKMEEYKTDSEHYFLFEYMPSLSIKFLTNDNYEMLGVVVDRGSIFGMNFSLNSDLHGLKEDIDTLVNPSLVDNAPTYMNFKSSFALIKDAVTLVQEKKAHLAYEVEVNNANDGSDYMDLNGDLDFDVTTMSAYATVNGVEGDREFSLTAGYQNETIYASLRDLKLSIKNQSIITLMDFINDKVKSLDVDSEEVIETITDVTEEINIDEIVYYVNNVPEYVSNFVLGDNYVSLTLELSFFELDVTPFDLRINFDNDSIKSISITGLGFSGYVVNASLVVSEFQDIEIDVDSYVALDPAINLLDNFDTLINQNQFGIRLNLHLDDHDETTNDFDISGQFQFCLKEVEVEKDGVVETHRRFNYGSGYIHIVDQNLYPHHIVADAKSDGSILFSYTGTSDGRTNAKFEHATIDTVYDLVNEFLEREEDQTSVELVENLMDQTTASPLDRILEGDYAALLETNIITSIDVNSEVVSLDLNGALVGMDDLNFNVTLRYTDNKINGLDITGLELSGKAITCSIDLYEFSDELYQEYSLVDDGSYIDLASLSILLRMGIDTTEFKYYYFDGEINLEVGSLFDAVSMDTQIAIQINDGRVKFYAHVDSPTSLLLGAFLDDYSVNIDRDAYLMYDSADGYWHFARNDTRSGNLFQHSKNYWRRRRYTPDYFEDHIMEILIGGMVGLCRTTYEDIFGDINEDPSSEPDENSGTSISTKNINYENVVESYYYNQDSSRFHFAVDAGELFDNSKMETLSLDIYHNTNGIFSRIVADMELDVLITLHLHVDLDLTGSLEATDEQTAWMDNYISENSNVELDQLVY